MMIVIKKTVIICGEWIIYNEDGIYASDSDNQITFRTKKDAINYVFNNTSDPRNTPKVIRIAAGYYEDTGKFSFSAYRIVKVTQDNLSEFQSEWDEQWKDENA
jgi:hypothetical protein